MAKIEVCPINPVVQRIGAKQQIRVLATYTDGEVRDVTREAFIDSGNTEVATAGQAGPDRPPSGAARRRSWPVTKGAYAATTLTVMGDRSGFAWTEPPDLRQDRRAGRRTSGSG